jgi:hypothetical protein
MSIKQRLARFKPIEYYLKGKKVLTDKDYLDVRQRNEHAKAKRPSRTVVINHLLSLRPGKTVYLEIGVRDPTKNFNRIKADLKYSVDPGVEFKENPVDFKLTSDEFFSGLASGRLLSKDTRFDVIFVDGLHLAPQVDKDIQNALNHIKDDGFIVLHDCNPPTEWHAREAYGYKHTPARGDWNGTTWKAFLKWRSEPSVHSCCIDSDWGVGVISKQHRIGDCIEAVNPFYEYWLLEDNRKTYLNLVDFETFKTYLER